MQYIFEWDAKKANINIYKHGISFENATEIFKDKNMITIFDEKHSENEERWVTIGLDLKTKILIVVHTFVEFSGNTKIRIISARKAIKNERKVYWEH